MPFTAPHAAFFKLPVYRADSLIENLLRDIVLHICAFVAEQEWHNLKRRQAQGIAVAKAQGKHLRSS